MSAVAESIPSSDWIDEAISTASRRNSLQGSPFDGFDGFDGFDAFTDSHLHLGYLSISATSVPPDTIGDQFAWQDPSPCER
ncbi:MAG: hypothetical protein DLM61_17070 [Pseudonocardiales bacterium]|nr:MAG: hypothetical protein DLM61_17070 [Pseudonocardiales bacterium]